MCGQAMECCYMAQERMDDCEIMLLKGDVDTFLNFLAAPFFSASNLKVFFINKYLSFLIK